SLVTLRCEFLESQLAVAIGVRRPGAHRTLGLASLLLTTLGARTTRAARRSRRTAKAPSALDADFPVATAIAVLAHEHHGRAGAAWTARAAHARTAVALMFLFGGEEFGLGQLAVLVGIHLGKAGFQHRLMPGLGLDLGAGADLVRGRKTILVAIEVGEG